MKNPPHFGRKIHAAAVGASALAATVLTAGLLGGGAVPASATPPDGDPASFASTVGAASTGTTGTTGITGTTGTPIKHVVVIFGENVSFDHYFASYPNAANIAGETQQGTGLPASAFTPAKKTPQNIATLAHDGLLANNPNAAQPQRLTPAQAVTCDQDHNYGAEQKAYNGGKMDKFVEYTSRDACGTNQFGRPGLTMDYYDGNTVTGLWNYAQHYAMSDAHFSTTFGPSTPGALNLVAGQTHGVKSFDPVTLKQTAAPDPYAVISPDAAGTGTVINDPDPAYDDCSNSSHAKSNNLAGMAGRNIGDLLNAKSVSWGWFQGGFTPTTAATSAAPASCLAAHTNVAGASVVDYSPHHQPFQYYKSTANPHHLAPASDAEIGHTGQANHQYDLTSFDKVVNSDNMPAVSFLKAAEYQDGHAAYSDPIDEQNFIVRQVNAIQNSKNWKDTAIVLAYDDSDGWYDHVAAAVKNSSNDPKQDAAYCLDAYNKGVPMAAGYADRCGPGPRQPLLVISPYAKKNFVDHTQTDQSSITRFIEDNWHTGMVGDGSADAAAGSLAAMFDFTRPHNTKLALDEKSGTVVKGGGGRGDGGQGDGGRGDGEGGGGD